MALYAIGDIQGCFEPFQSLLEQIRFDPAADRLWLTGDLVNRGPGSLDMLRWAYTHRDQIRMVLGNHDLHLLAVAAGHGRLHKTDTLAPLLAAPDAPVLLDWLRHQPLVHWEQGWLMVHAGLLPQWSAEQALALSDEVSAWLRGPNHSELFRHMYGNEPKRWHDDLQGWDRLRLIVNAMTRMRLTTRDGDIDLAFKGELPDAPATLCAWFDAPGRRSAGQPIVCGHWSALGLCLRDDLAAIDTGCLWGGSLTAIRLDDRQVFQLPCAAAADLAQWQ
ncbi:bis(5'-nucleosyl)-tetraphosphatase (symmetrical) [Chitinivorax tropicus]|uniref:Bis(5'-nucleosyl)-tetraphosphatase, symmetrical n=1 Tax=Chitinivorax tropicus TaxID=714531 RepID=A0A840MLF1_9PROT|nr:symmetrical bis(5'-nucleosyl)-tetraphosphatase [Chitinivorax tropicus]MBB5018325.1 bis(5'-nucleosyl)-tetraphosphatase (symmetrical) [Chitinivorax tropicus]